MHDWRMDISTDSYFQHPEKYYRESKPSIDKKKLNSIFEKYKGLKYSQFAYIKL